MTEEGGCKGVTCADRVCSPPTRTAERSRAQALLVLQQYVVETSDLFHHDHLLVEVDPKSLNQKCHEKSRHPLCETLQR